MIKLSIYLLDTAWPHGSKANLNPRLTMVKKICRCDRELEEGEDWRHTGKERGTDGEWGTHMTSEEKEKIYIM